MASNNKSRSSGRLKRQKRLRYKIKGTSEKPRLSVYRSLNQIYVQIIDDTDGKVITGISSLTKSLNEKVKETRKKGKTEISKLIGKEIAQKALDMKIKQVVFDRNGFIYHGRVKAVAEGAREGGLKF